MMNNSPGKGQSLRKEAEACFNSLRTEGMDVIPFQRLLEMLKENGISRKDRRFKKVLEPYLQGGGKERLGKEEFMRIFAAPEAELLRKASRKDFVIPDFAAFQKDIEDIFEEVRSETQGEMHDTLPHPAPDRQPAFAVSICTIDGQLLQLGDHDLGFLLQSVNKPMNYAIALEEVGSRKLHRHVGTEPGSESFESAMMLNEDGLPHNPMLTSGAIMTCSLIKPELPVEERLEHVMGIWEKMTGDREVRYEESSFEAEWRNRDRHLSLAHLMKERNAFPEGVDLEKEIEFYMKCCAIEVNIDDLAHAAAALASYGTCPSTGRKVFSHDSVRDTLSLMLSSGMYDHSGEFAFRVGLPAKSGIAGGVMVVIPQLMGISVYSPPLDRHSNSVRGVKFCERLVDRFNFHHYDAVGMDIHGKKDPRRA